MEAAGGGGEGLVSVLAGVAWTGAADACETAVVLVCLARLAASPTSGHSSPGST